MPTDPTIALSYRQPPEQSPLESIGKVMNLQSMMQNRELQKQHLQQYELQNEERRRQMQAERDMAGLVMSNTKPGPDGKPLTDHPAVVQKLYELGHPTFAAKYNADWRAAEAATRASKTSELEGQIKALDLQGKKIDMMGGAYASMKDENDEPGFRVGTEQAISLGVVDPKTGQQMVNDGPKAWWPKIQNFKATSPKVRAAIKAQRDELEAAHKALMYPFDEQKAEAGAAEAVATSEERQRQNASTVLRGSKDQAEYDKKRGKLPFAVASQFPDKFDAETVRKLGVTPAQAAPEKPVVVHGEQGTFFADPETGKAREITTPAGASIKPNRPSGEGAIARSREDRAIRGEWKKEVDDIDSELYGKGNNPGLYQEALTIGGTLKKGSKFDRDAKKDVKLSDSEREVLQNRIGVVQNQITSYHRRKVQMGASKPEDVGMKGSPAPVAAPAPAPAPSPAAQKTVTAAHIQAYARAKGITEAEAKKDFQDFGYTVQ